MMNDDALVAFSALLEELDELGVNTQRLEEARKAVGQCEPLYRPYTKADLDQALRHHLGDSVVSAMLASGVNRPSIVDQAALKMVLNDTSRGPFSGVIRMALYHLHEDSGHFVYRDPPNNGESAE